MGPILFLFLCILLQVSLLIVSTNGDAYFYIYEWPKDLADVYPPPGAVLDKNSKYDHAFNENYGAGELLVPDYGLFQTWQFSLYKNVMSRLAVSKYRTRDPTKASAFIVPFDAGVHSYIDHKTGKPRLASPHGWYAIQLLKEAATNPVFWKHNGHDHFVFFSITINQMVGIGVKVFFMNICQNCTVMTIETSPTNTAISGRSHKYWYAVPYPSSFHWWEGIKHLPWEVNSLTTARRDILSLFIGSVKTMNVNSNSLRRTLYQQCTADAACQWHNTAHACNGVVNASSQMMLFQRAQYCPAPPGDSITRKSLFDSLVSGCVPVLFAKASLRQYLFFFTEEEISEVSVFIPKQQVQEAGVNYLETLRSITPAELLRKQRAIERIAPRLQYSVMPKNMGNGSDGRTWSSPFPDAVDVITEKLLDRKTIEPINGFSEEDLIRQKCLQNDIMQNHADYTGMDAGKTKGAAGSHVSSRIWNKNKCQNYTRENAFQGSTYKIEW